MITGTRGVVVGRVATLRPHPNGDFIWLADLDIGTGQAPQIVWGGLPVVREGDLVPVARPGAWLPATTNKRGPYKSAAAITGESYPRACYAASRNSAGMRPSLTGSPSSTAMSFSQVILSMTWAKAGRSFSGQPMTFARRKFSRR
ncbi:MAG: hypothetical protein M3Z75_31860 [Actinomycetota bacterium]|nr:hypothetical protein [Actinomycetota bacterium]